MPVSFLIRHWKKELQVFHKNLLLLKNSSTSTAIHDLRVSIKKLRSYTKLYSALFKNNKAISLFEETKNLFSALGRQRNIEISLELLNRLKTKEPFAPMLKHFDFCLQETKQRSVLALHQYKTDGLTSLTIEIEKSVSATNDETTKADLLKLIRSCISEVKHQMKNFDKNYHRVRKKLKDIFYWSLILPGGFYFSKEEIKTLKSILDDLGDLQNHEMLLINLRIYRNTFVAKGSAEYDEIKKLEDRTKKDKQKRLDKTCDVINSFLKENKKSDPQKRDRLSAPGGS